jgi:hypothetical protein
MRRETKAALDLCPMLALSIGQPVGDPRTSGAATGTQSSTVTGLLLFTLMILVQRLCEHFSHGRCANAPEELNRGQ